MLLHPPLVLKIEIVLLRFKSPIRACTGWQNLSVGAVKKISGVGRKASNYGSQSIPEIGLIAGKHIGKDEPAAGIRTGVSQYRTRSVVAGKVRLHEVKRVPLRHARIRNEPEIRPKLKYVITMRPRNVVGKVMHRRQTRGRPRGCGSKNVAEADLIIRGIPERAHRKPRETVNEIVHYMVRQGPGVANCDSLRVIPSARRGHIRKLRGLTKQIILIVSAHKHRLLRR